MLVLMLSGLLNLLISKILSYNRDWVVSKWIEIIDNICVPESFNTNTQAFWLQNSLCEFTTESINSKGVGTQKDLSFTIINLTQIWHEDFNL